MKNKEELNALKNEVKALNEKLAELSEEELKEVTGGKGNVSDEKTHFKPLDYKQPRNKNVFSNDDLEH